MWKLSGNHFFYDYSNPGRKANCRLERKEPNFDAHFTRLQKAPLFGSGGLRSHVGPSFPFPSAWRVHLCFMEGPALLLSRDSQPICLLHCTIFFFFFRLNELTDIKKSLERITGVFPRLPLPCFGVGDPKTYAHQQRP